MFSTDFIFRQQENNVDKQKCQAGFRPLYNKILLFYLFFFLASISKPLAVTAAARLYEQGKLDLDAPISEYVKSWPEKHPPITVRQIASHTSGIRHYKSIAKFKNYLLSCNQFIISHHLIKTFGVKRENLLSRV